MSEIALWTTSANPIVLNCARRAFVFVGFAGGAIRADPILVALRPARVRREADPGHAAGALLADRVVAGPAFAGDVLVVAALGAVCADEVVRRVGQAGARNILGVGLACPAGPTDGAVVDAARLLHQVAFRAVAFDLAHGVVREGACGDLDLVAAAHRARSALNVTGSLRTAIVG
eukprot:CAMPEP_0113676556 /NCGR_PEP_ID=MMETSP0038_2-20120614/8711_1 /TAXON_ID=2898 /ORGANISM="Cryptomonas paramecium" /LENGTH=174 /DNA_ID=CAMNT_0000593603 /DNA_START=2250 /DNA_END=2774 /DNA_ORIENTATION=+ /assembly_acc=CAM_ASM_000170